MGPPVKPEDDGEVVAETSELVMPALYAGIQNLGVEFDDPGKSWMPGSAGHDGASLKLRRRLERQKSDHISGADLLPSRRDHR